MEGWIKLHRRLFDNQLWLSEQFTSGQAWVDLLMLANHKPGIINVRGIRLSIDRGQCGWSALSLARRWKWSRGKVLRFIDYLVQQNMIQTVQQKNCITTVITIVNYKQYQDNSTANGTANRAADGTANGQQTDTNNNGNKEKKQTKTFTVNSPQFHLASKLWIKIQSTGTASKPPDIQSWADEIDKIHRIDKRPWDFIGILIINIFNDEFWKKNIRSAGTLRKQINNGHLDKLLPDVSEIETDESVENRFTNGLQ